MMHRASTVSRRAILSIPVFLAAGAARRAQALEVQLYPLENLRRHVEILNTYDAILERQALVLHVAERFPELAEEVPHLAPQVVESLHGVVLALPKEKRALLPGERIALREALLTVMSTRGVTPQVYLNCQRMLLSYELTRS